MAHPRQKERFCHSPQITGFCEGSFLRSVIVHKNTYILHNPLFINNLTINYNKLAVQKASTNDYKINKSSSQMARTRTRERNITSLIWHRLLVTVIPYCLLLAALLLCVYLYLKSGLKTMLLSAPSRSPFPSADRPNLLRRTCWLR